MLKFRVTGQSLNRTDFFSPVEKSINFLKAEFEFSPEWEDLDKKAICRSNSHEEEYDAHILNNTCLIPWEVIEEDGSFEICVKGTGVDVTITTSVVTVDVGETLVGGAEANPPSPTELDWMRQSVAEMRSMVDELETELQPKTLCVTLSDDMATASHSSDEIYAYVQSGGQAVLVFQGVIHMSYIMAQENTVIFGFTAYAFDAATSISAIIDSNKNVSLFEARIPTEDNVRQLIPSHLPNPYALKINGVSYTGSGPVTIDIPHGENGADGKDGEDGITPHIGSNGNWYLGTTNTGVKAAGSDGADGLTPYIGDNGNWWIGETDTGTMASGTSSSAGAGRTYAQQIDDIETTEEGLTEIELDLDLTQCMEARIYISVPANGSGTNYSFYLVSGDGIYQNNLCLMTAYTALMSGSYIRYVAVTDTLGEINYATGMQGGDITVNDKSGGVANMQVPKAPRTVEPGLKLVSGNKTAFTFPVGTRIMTFAWNK